GHVKAKDATPLLVQQLFMRDTDLGTKQRILASLGKIGDRRATGPIMDFLSRTVDPAVRGNAIFALGDIGDPAALPSLEALAKEGQDPLLRSLAAEAVRKIRARPAPAVVPPALAVDRRGQGSAPASPEPSGVPHLALAQVLAQRLGDEAAQEALLSQALQAHAPPEVLRDARVQVHQDLGVVPSKPMRERHWEAPNV